MESSDRTAVPALESADPCALSALALSAGYADGSLSPIDVTRAVLMRWREVNPLVNAIYEVDEQSALRTAAESERRWRLGAPLGRLDGVPVSVKDHLSVLGMSSPRGLIAQPRVPAGFDAPAVAHLRRAGAVLFGKSNMPELSIMPVTDSVAFGPTRHPSALHLYAGGSSGGAAAAVASGIGPLALATDGGGSIRIPAALTGLVGFKPTHGRVPYFPRPTERTVAGPIGRTVADVAAAMNIIARPDGRDWTELPSDDIDYLEALAVRSGPLRIAFSPTYGFQQVDRGVATMVAKAVDRLSDLGHVIEQVDFVCDDAQEISTLQACISLSELSERLGEVERNRLPKATREALRRGVEVEPHAQRRMLALREILVHQLHCVFERFDVIVSPTVPMAHLEVGTFYPDGDLLGPQCRAVGGFTRPHNIAHTPAISLPCGHGPDGLPIGLQLAGRRFDDARLLALAATMEASLRCEPGRPVGEVDRLG